MRVRQREKEERGYRKEQRQEKIKKWGLYKW
jgi:hypothetical protein